MSGRELKSRRRVATLRLMRRVLPILCGFAFGIVFAAPSRAQTTTQSPAPADQAQTSPQSRELDVPGNQPWTDAGVDLQAGQTVTITATGKLRYMDGNAPGPEGLGRSWRDVLRALPVNSAGRGALIGRVGSDEAAQPFLVGPKLQTPVRAVGRLYLGINGPSGDSAEGSFHVTIALSGAAAASTGAKTAASNTLASGQASAGQSPSSAAAATPTATTTTATLPPDLLKQIPRRVTDKDGNAGDM